MWLIDAIFRHHNGTTLPFIKEMKQEGDVVIVKLKGNIDASTIPIIMANRSEQHIEHVTENNLLIDLEEVKHVDSSTLASLILLLNDLKHHHKKLGIINVSPYMRDFLKIARLKRYVHEYENQDAALEDLNKEYDEKIAPQQDSPQKID